MFSIYHLWIFMFVPNWQLEALLTDLPPSQSDHSKFPFRVDIIYGNNLRYDIYASKRWIYSFLLKWNFKISRIQYDSWGRNLEASGLFASWKMNWLLESSGQCPKDLIKLHRSKAAFMTTIQSVLWFIWHQLLKS